MSGDIRAGRLTATQRGSARTKSDRLRIVEVILLPQLTAALAKEAPSIEIIFKGPDPKSIEGAMALAQ
jgi:hypothetical protein